MSSPTNIQPRGGKNIQQSSCEGKSPAERAGNFMKQFRRVSCGELRPISAAQLLAIWNHYDQDGNGYLEGGELDCFLKELITSTCNDDVVGDDVVSPALYSELKQDFMDAYDDNDDGRIEIRELAQMLPVDETFLLLFQLDNHFNNSVDFMRIWKKYDHDGDGTIDCFELKAFMRDVLDKAHGRDQQVVDDAKLAEYCDAMTAIFDKNGDGVLQLSELARLVPIRETVLKDTVHGTLLKGCRNIDFVDIERIFNSYDVDKNESIEGDELTGFVKDLLEIMKPDYSIEDVSRFEKLLLRSCDLDGDGKIGRDELTVLLLGIQKFM